VVEDARFAAAAIIVEPRPARRTSRCEAVAKRRPTHHAGFARRVAINAKLYKQLGYDPLKELYPISLARGSLCVYASGTLPLNSIAELTLMPRRSPASSTYASSAVGSARTSRGALSRSRRRADDACAVQGHPAVAPDLVSGAGAPDVQRLRPLAQFVQSGLKMLATTAARRPPQLPRSYHCGIGPAGIRAAGCTASSPPRTARVLARLNTEVVKALNDRELAEPSRRWAWLPSPQTLEEPRASSPPKPRNGPRGACSGASAE